MKYIFRPLIVVGICCTGLFLSGYSYADRSSDHYNNVNRYQKHKQHKDHLCDKRDCKSCRNHNHAKRQNRQVSFSLRNTMPYFYVSFGRNDDRFRFGRWNKGHHYDESYNYRHGHKHHGKKHRKCC